ncbi:MAG: hypothetical protein FRX49_02176 [Trebouxia sp. A1-2]|nr:MAG: hypothetical protein FRX49_02176 [Trebouxia sp. A1-2]
MHNVRCLEEEENNNTPNKLQGKVQGALDGGALLLMLAGSLLQLLQLRLQILGLPLQLLRLATSWACLDWRPAASCSSSLCSLAFRSATSASCSFTFLPASLLPSYARACFTLEAWEARAIFCLLNLSSLVIAPSRRYEGFSQMFGASNDNIFEAVQAADLFESLILLISPSLCLACQVAGHPTCDAAGLGKQGAIKGGYLVPFGALTP